MSGISYFIQSEIPDYAPSSLSGMTCFYSAAKPKSNQNSASANKALTRHSRTEGRGIWNLLLYTIRDSRLRSFVAIGNDSAFKAQPRQSPIKIKYQRIKL